MAEVLANLPLGRGYRLTVEHSASSYGVPVLVGPDGQAFGPYDFVMDEEWTAGRVLAADLVERLYGERSAESGSADSLATVRAFLGPL